MKKRLGVITEDFSLFKRLQLLMREDFDTVMLKKADSSFNALVYDCDTASCEPPPGAVLLSRDPSSHAGALGVPFSLVKMKSILRRVRPVSELMTVDVEKRTVSLGGRTVKLTEVEARLLFKLYSAKDYVSREELLSCVWGEGADPGVLNVYVHYLREKLEKENERVIISSRKLGYRIDGRLLGDVKAD